MAVLGAGLTGACVALELAEEGCEIDLFDRASEALTGASLNCEGKLHLGLVYGMDLSGRTARLMLDGALSFVPLLERWVSSSCWQDLVSDPFIYAVAQDSLVDVEHIRAHFSRVEIMLDQLETVGGGYVGAPGVPLWRQLDTVVQDEIFDRRRVSAAFMTRERAIDPAPLCQALRESLLTAPRVTMRTGTEIIGVKDHGTGGFEVRSPHGPPQLHERYDAVVNATWEGRLAVDASLGLETSRPVAHRYKMGFRTTDPGGSPELPSVTFMLGPYGDTVRYPEATYISWYPTGLLSQEFTLAPSRGIDDRDHDYEGLLEGSLAALRRLMPGAAGALDPSRPWRPSAGYITAWGASGIEDRGSQLHERHAVGVFSRNGYYSIDTGKLTLAPYFASIACARILGRAESG